MNEAHRKGEETMGRGRMDDGQGMAGMGLEVWDVEDVSVMMGHK